MIISKDQDKELYGKAIKYLKNKNPWRNSKINLSKESYGIDYKKLARSHAEEELGKLEEKAHIAIIEEEKSKIKEPSIKTKYFKLNTKEYKILETIKKRTDNTLFLRN